MVTERITIAVTLNNLDPYEAQSLIWLATTGMHAKDGRSPIDVRGVIEALDYFVSVMLDEHYWSEAAEYEDIAGLQQRLQRTLVAIERGITPEEA